MNTDWLEAETEDVLRRRVVEAGIPWWPFTRTPEYAAWCAAHKESYEKRSEPSWSIGESTRAGFNPLQPRDPGGEGGGQWVKAGGSGVAALDPPDDDEIVLHDVEPMPPEDLTVQVTGRTLKQGDKFWIPGGQYQVTVDAGGLGRYIRVVDLETGRPMLMKAHQKVTVLKADFPAAAKRATRVAPMHVTGELGKVFTQTPGKTNPITLAAQEASDELAEIGITLPDDLQKIPLKETRARGTAGQFVWQQSTRTGEVTGTLMMAKDKEAASEMPSTVHHEVGHYLDMMVFPKIQTRYDNAVYAPGVQPSTRVRVGQATYASAERTPEIAGPVMDAIDASRAGQRLKDMETRPSQYAVRLPAPSLEGETTTRMNQYPIDRSHVRYVNDSSEKFARAYEQYVSTKVGKRADHYSRGQAQAADDYYLEPGEDKRGFYGWYWDPEDFKPIEAEFDAMFGRLGWLKN